MDATKMSGAAPCAKQGTPRKERISPGQPPPTPLSAEQVYHDYAPRVFNMARRMVSNDVDAEDVTQDVLLQVVRKLPSFRGESAFPTWLHRVTVNAALSHRRRRAVRQEHGLAESLEAFGEDGPSQTTGPDAQVLTHEIRTLIERAIESLPSAYRTVFVLADVEGLPNAAIAAQLDLSLPAIKSRLHRARLMMRDALAPYFSAS
jgi:RNA polymerase sigma-70 factor (ECF subfamily)